MILDRPLPAVDDVEGARLAAGLPPVIDAHVHLFPDRVAEAVWRWFDSHGWPIRYKLPSPAVIEFLLARGVERLVALHYSHKPGMARALNRYVAEIVRAEPRVVGMATVLPGEPDAGGILREAFGLGLRGVKLHCHVQCFAPDDDALEEIYAACEAAAVPLVMHAGREPASPAYKCDPGQLCGVERTARVLAAHPRLRLCIPHLGADEMEAHLRLLERFDNLWLDTTMAVADYLPGFDPPWRLIEARPDRVMYGTDFPNIPYAWDREIGKLAARLGDDALERVLGGTARGFFGIGVDPDPR